MSGRWPPNLLMTHSAFCEYRGTRQLKEPRTPGTSKRTGRNAIFGSTSHDTFDYLDAAGYETVEDWRCHPSCPAKELGDAARFFPTFSWSEEDFS